MQLNVERFYKYLDGFKAYIEFNSNAYMMDLANNQFFLSQEGYKYNVYNNAQNILNFSNWSPSDIGTGKIAEKAIQAVDEGANLVHHQQKLHFKNKVHENTQKAEHLLYNLYCGDKDAQAFDDVVKFLGGKYDLIAYLFFIKNNEKYLPINSSNFDERFAMLSIPLRMSRNCSSQNYFSFVSCIDTLRQHMESYYGFDVSLLDAHSVIWQLGLANKYVVETEERNADAILTQEVNVLLPQKDFKPTGYTGKPIERPKPIVSNGYKVYLRNRFTALNALYIAKNCCELDPSHESFVRKNSDKKYMEPHHLVPMCESEKFTVSLDREENIICLCSNCHNEIHYGKRAKEIVAIFYEQRKDLLKSVGIDISLADLLKIY